MDKQRITAGLKGYLHGRCLQRIAGKWRKAGGLYAVAPDTNAAAGGYLKRITASFRGMQRDAQPTLAMGGNGLHAGKGHGIAGSDVGHRGGR